MTAAVSLCTIALQLAIVWHSHGVCTGNERWISSSEPTHCMLCHAPTSTEAPDCSFVLLPLPRSDLRQIEPVLLLPLLPSVLRLTDRGPPTAHRIG
ncbi:MAG: hypothetical protein NZ606_02045 [Candidatus Kapabacteria bacterium]|nr:hypothetical protein [Candidatus Kapabacteria bacterium]MCX7937594.1 hypothetical protein [Chlorobiota bacterium]